MSQTQPLKQPMAAAPSVESPAGAAQRVLVLLYGVSVYVAFLGVFLYTIGFVSGLWVPKTLDSGATTPLGEALLVNGLLLGLFAVQHTIMARPAFKTWFARFLPASAERSTFVLMTIGILATLFWQWRPLGGVIWTVESPLWSGVLYAISGIGWVTVLLATFLIDHFDLFGLRQVVLQFRGIPYRTAEFQERSLYRLVRHPLLLGFLIAFWATPVMTWSHLFFAGMTTLYMLVGIEFEERDLIGAHGDAYRDYRRRVPMLLPLGRKRAS
jgi:protein-S-isoprenylcysteine O-methyltransferase Ste14